MLHHVPSAELQDTLLAETFRVLKPGGIFAGADSVPSFMWNLFHLGDIRVPIDANTFGVRLEAAGFEDVRVERVRTSCRFYGKKPA